MLPGPVGDKLCLDVSGMNIRAQSG
jgi:hypothetical protein